MKRDNVWMTKFLKNLNLGVKVVLHLALQLAGVNGFYGDEESSALSQEYHVSLS